MVTTPNTTHQRRTLLCVQLSPAELALVDAAVAKSGFEVRSRWVRLVLHQALSGRRFNWRAKLRPAGDDAVPYRFRVDAAEIEAVREILAAASSGAGVWTPSEYLTALVLAAVDLPDIVGWTPPRKTPSAIIEAVDTVLDGADAPDGDELLAVE